MHAAHEAASVHEVEAFGVVATLMLYTDLDDAIALAARVSRQPGRHAVHRLQAAAEAVPRLAAWYGPLHLLDAEASAESTGHGSPLPGLMHGGPVRVARAQTGARQHGPDTLRFVKPVGIGDTIQARLTCKRKTYQPHKPTDTVGQGVAAWDVQVTNQDGAPVASYDILTLVAKQAPA